MNNSEEISPRKTNPFSITLPELLALIPGLLLVAGFVISSARLLQLSIWGTLLVLAVNLMLFRTRLPLGTPARYAFFVSIVIAAALLGWGFVEGKSLLFTAGFAVCMATIILAYIFPRGDPLALQIYGKNFELPWLVPIFHSAIAVALTVGFFGLIVDLLIMNSAGKIPLASVWLALAFGLSTGVFLIIAVFFPRSFPRMGSHFGPSYSLVRPHIAGLAVLMLLSVSGFSALVAYVQLHPATPQQDQQSTHGQRSQG